MEVKINELGRLLAYGSTSSARIAVMALLGYLLGRPFLETVTVVVSLAVAAISEGLGFANLRDCNACPWGVANGSSC